MPIRLGQRFGRLVVIDDTPIRTDPKHPKYRCRCDCGKETLVQPDNFARTRSCGCLRVEQLRERSITHGLTKSREYKSWADMIARCTRHTATGYAQYGAKGITVCQRWLDAFENFYADMGPMPSQKHTLDRIKNELGYEPANCRWETRKTQRINQKRQILYTHGGVTGTAKDLAIHFGANKHTVHDRMWRLGWNIHDAIAEGIRVSLRHLL